MTRPQPKTTDDLAKAKTHFAADAGETQRGDALHVRSALGDVSFTGARIEDSLGFIRSRVRNFGYAVVYDDTMPRNEVQVGRFHNGWDTQNFQRVILMHPDSTFKLEAQASTLAQELRDDLARIVWETERRLFGDTKESG